MLQKLRRSSDEKGFTLIELLIVIIILGILAAIVVFAVGSTRKDAVNSACKTDVKSIQLAVEAVKTKSGKYPATQAAALATSTSTDGQVLKAWPGGTYPAGNNPTFTDDLDFQYTQVSSTTYTLDVGGKNIQGGQLTQDSADGPVGTSGTVEFVCKGT